MEASGMKNFNCMKSGLGGSESRAAGRSANRGFTLIELLIGISILSVVGAMTMMLTGAASRMYRSTIRTSEIQTESQTVSRRITRAVMDASSIYLDESGEGTVLFTGEIDEDIDFNMYYGEMFWWDKDSGCLYQGSSVSVKVDKTEGEKTKINGTERSTGGSGEAGGSGESGEAGEGGESGKDGNQPPGALTGAAAREFFLGGTSSGREYLISDKLKEMSLTIHPGFDEEEKNADGTVTVNYKLTFSYLDSGDYSVESSAATRNTVYVPQRKGGALSRENLPAEEADQ